MSRNRVDFAIPGYDPWATAPEGCRYDEEAGEEAVAFFAECLVHVKGEWAGQPFVLDRWQAGPIRALFGWKREDGTRRYRTVFIYVPRKNGKSTLVAGLALYVLFCDGEPGAECYVAAADRGQASILYEMAVGMVQCEPMLDERCQAYKTAKRLTLYGGGGFLGAISAEAASKHGYSPHLAIVDELHAQPNRQLVDVLASGMGARRQPIMVYLTTADYARPSICNETLERARAVRDGTLDVPGFLPVIYEATREDDWQDPKVWEAANPGYPVSPKQSFLEEEFARAGEEPSYENTAKRLYLNIQTEQVTRWLPLDAWDACKREVDREALKGMRCYGGLDLSRTTDMTAVVLVFPDAGNVVLPWFWVPAARVAQRPEYQEWEARGLLEVTDGEVVDYRAVRKTLGELAAEFELVQLAYDPYNATQLVIELADEDGLEMVEFRQGPLSMNAPTKELERLVISGDIAHDGHAVLRWMAANVAVREDDKGNIRPVKPSRSSRQLVDGIVALIMALGVAMAGEEPQSQYETEGLLVL